MNDDEWSSYQDRDYAPENQRPVCECRACRSEGRFESGRDCLWFRTGDQLVTASVLSSLFDPGM